MVVRVSVAGQKEIITSCYSIPTLEGIGSNRSPRPQSNLNVRTGICSAFAVPTSPGICVLKFKMKFYEVLHVRTLGTMITGYRCQLYTHFVLISCHCIAERNEADRCYRKFDRSEILSRRSYFLGNFFYRRALLFPRKYYRLQEIRSLTVS